MTRPPIASLGKEYILGQEQGGLLRLLFLVESGGPVDNHIDGGGGRIGSVSLVLPGDWKIFRSCLWVRLS